MRSKNGLIYPDFTIAVDGLKQRLIYLLGILGCKILNSDGLLLRGNGLSSGSSKYNALLTMFI